MLILQVLRYDICAITPHDFVDLLLSRLPISRQHTDTVRQHTQTFIALCATGSFHFFILHLCVMNSVSAVVDKVLGWWLRIHPQNFCNDQMKWTTFTEMLSKNRVATSRLLSHEWLDVKNRNWHVKGPVAVAKNVLR